MRADSTTPIDLAGGPLCPVDRMPRRQRNRICIWIMAAGAANFLLYTIIYAGLGGDARNGSRRFIPAEDGTTQATYYLRGHHIRNLHGEERQVSRAVWVYSYAHSITLPITASAMIISMLVLARPHIIATMRDGYINGQTFVTVFGTIVVVVTLIATTLFAWDFVAQLSEA